MQLRLTFLRPAPDPAPTEKRLALDSRRSCLGAHKLFVRLGVVLLALPGAVS